MAIAAAISRFGFDPGAALATVVGVLIEVPVVLLVVHVVDRSRDGCEQRRSPARGSPSDRQVCRQSPAHDYALKGMRTGRRYEFIATTLRFTMAYSFTPPGTLPPAPTSLRRWLGPGLLAAWLCYSAGALGWHLASDPLLTLAACIAR